MREKPILVGLYLSKFDQGALKRLGFNSFTEAFNVLGYAVGAPPSSIKNYRDEFDPLFPNPRKGWHKRPRREHCLKIMEEYKELDLQLFTELIESFAAYFENNGSVSQTIDADIDGGSDFAKRLITGLAAENYFEKNYKDVPEFRDCVLQNTTQYGCGYDIRLHPPASRDFLAVEVKGLTACQGTLSLTPKEYVTAEHLRERFFLFVVKNFADSPFHETFQDPLRGDLQFRRQERTIVQVSWLASV